MKIKLPSSPLSVELAGLFPQSFSLKSGMPCRLARSKAPGFQIRPSGSAEITIQYADTDDLMLALGELMAMPRPAFLENAPALSFRGIMLDASRNAVPTVAFLKRRIVELALLGMNRFCLYTEDTYPVPGEPLFGYARGCYTAAELRELSRWGRLFGVTLFPCIQTLGHMEQILKFPHYHPLKDNDSVYNVKAKGVYDFIAKTIDAAVAPFDTDLIHIGMDETFGLGRGLAFEEDKKINPRAMYVDHVVKVAAICRAKGLKPMMWGDIVLGGAGEHGVGKLAKRIPKDLVMNHWNYARCDEKSYAKDIAAFRKMGYEPMLSPGVWSWSRFFPSFSKAASNIETLIGAGRKAGLSAALNTHWGDDGHECFFDLNLPAHAFFLAQCVDEKDHLGAARRRFAAVFGTSLDAVAATEEIETADYKVKALLPPNAGKCYFYDDPAQGLFTGLPFVKARSTYYAARAARFRKAAAQPGRFRELFRLAETFCDFLALKADLRRRAVAAYKRGDRRALATVAKDIPRAIKRLETFRRLYRAYWLSERSPFGLEVIEGRMGALGARLEYLGSLLKDHLAGTRASLPELEFPHYSMFHESRSPDYQPTIWPEFFLHFSALASRNIIKWW